MYATALLLAAVTTAAPAMPALPVCHVKPIPVDVAHLQSAKDVKDVVVDASPGMSHDTADAAMLSAALDFIDVGH